MSWNPAVGPILVEGEQQEVMEAEAGLPLQPRRVGSLHQRRKQSALLITLILE